MPHSKKHLKITRYFILIILFSNTFRSFINLKILTPALLLLCILLITNELIRFNVKKALNRRYYFSLTFSIIGAALLKYFINDFVTNLYMFFCVMEILYIKGRKKHLLLILHGILYMSVVVLNTKTTNFSERLTIFGTSLLTYCSLICIIYLSLAFRNEKEETKKLNEELKASNIKLQEYSLKVEELSVARERERVAQELHDSLGHSLMALTMHLEFAEKIFDTNPEKAKEVIIKSKEISKDSTASLRTAVNTLKEERNIEALSDSVKELIDGFGILGNITINYNLDKQLETVNPEIKLCIYKTIRESLTNGIKHGKATVFDLNIGMYENRVKLSIKDNGIGCDNIISSNGLKGIENRISALGGTVDFISRANRGFLIESEILLYEEGK